MVNLVTLSGHVGQQGNRVVVVPGMLVIELKVRHLYPLFVWLAIESDPSVDRGISTAPMPNRDLVIKCHPLADGIEKAVPVIVLSVPTVIVTLLQFEGRLVACIKTSGAAARVHRWESVIVVVIGCQFHIPACRRRVVENHLLPAGVHPLIRDHLFRETLPELHVERETLPEVVFHRLPPIACGISACASGYFKAQRAGAGCLNLRVERPSKNVVPCRI